MGDFGKPIRLNGMGGLDGPSITGGLGGPKSLDGPEGPSGLVALGKSSALEGLSKSVSKISVDPGALAIAISESGRDRNRGSSRASVCGDTSGSNHLVNTQSNCMASLCVSMSIVLCSKANGISGL